jgi:hypothetical protein
LPLTSLSGMAKYRGDSDRFYVGATKYNSTNNERDIMDWDKVIDWDRVANLTDDEVDVILGIFEKGQ